MTRVMSKRRHFCRVLGLSPSASRDEIRQAYRRLAKKWHPDRNPDHPYAERRFREIKKAYEALTSTREREAPDAGGRSPGSWHEDWTPSRGAAERNFFQRDGLDIVCDVPVTVPEAVLGFTLQMPTLRGKTLRVKITPGVRDATTLRVPGRGAVNGDERGDQLARIRIAFPEDPGRDPDRRLWEARDLGDDWPEDVRVLALAVGSSGGPWVAEASRGLIAALSDLRRPAILANLDPRDPELDRLFNAVGRPGLGEVIEGLADLQKMAIRPRGETFAYLPMGRRENLWSAAQNRDPGNLTRRLLRSRLLRSVAEGIRQREGFLALYLPAGAGQAATESELIDGWVGLGAGATELPSWADLRSLGRIPRLSSGQRINPRRRWAPVTLDEPVKAPALRRDASGRPSSGSHSSPKGDGSKKKKKKKKKRRKRKKKRLRSLLRAAAVVVTVALSMLAGWYLARLSS